MLPLADYGLQGGSVTPLHGGTINRVYRIDAPRGVFALKQYAASTLNRDALERIGVAQRLARDAGVPVPETVPSREGDAFIERDGVFYVLSRFVHGRLYPPGTMPSRAAIRMGEMHARLLDALSDLPADEVPPLPRATWIEEHLRRLLAIGETRRACDPVDEQACGILEQKLRLLQEVSGPPAFAWQWTHGDYEWRNVLFNQDDEVVAVLDFDNLVYYGRERDVMRCIALTFPAGAPEAAVFSRAMPRRAA